MTAVLKASDWLNSQLSSIMQPNSREALFMEQHVCTSIMLEDCHCELNCVQRMYVHMASINCSVKPIFPQVFVFKLLPGGSI